MLLHPSLDTWDTLDPSYTDDFFLSYEQIKKVIPIKKNIAVTDEERQAVLYILVRDFNIPIFLNEIGNVYDFDTLVYYVAKGDTEQRRLVGTLLNRFWLENKEHPLTMAPGYEDIGYEELNSYKENPIDNKNFYIIAALVFISIILIWVYKTVD